MQHETPDSDRIPRQHAVSPGSPCPRDRLIGSASSIEASEQPQRGHLLGAVLLLVGGKLVLSLKLQFQLGLFELLLKVNDLAGQFFVRLFERSDLVGIQLTALIACICDIDNRADRGTAT